MRGWLIALALAASASGGAAAARDLDVPADKGWQHSQTGLILMSSLAGEPRTGLTDAGDAEMDVAAQYGSGAGDVSITVYLFHPGLDDVAVWFDRVDVAVRARDIYGGATPVGAAEAFARPGSAATDSLRQVYLPHKPPYRATAAAMMPLGDWLVAIRISSKVDDPAALATKLDAAIRGIRFPAKAPASHATAPLAPCTTTLATRHAHLVKPDGSQLLISAIMPQVAADEAAKQTTPAAPIVFCRHGEPTTDYTLLRQDNDEQAYWLALGDAGIAAYVSSGASALMGKANYSVQLLKLDAVDTFQSFNVLPEPAQVLQLIERSSPLSSSHGKNITISTTALDPAKR